MQHLNFVPDRILAAYAPSNVPKTTVAQVVTLTGAEGELVQFAADPDVGQNAALSFLGRLARDGATVTDRAGAPWRYGIVEVVLPYSAGADAMLGEVATRLRRGAVDPAVDVYPIGPWHESWFDPVINGCHQLQPSELRDADRIRRMVAEGQDPEPVIAEAGRIADVLDGKCWLSAASRR